MIVTYKTAKLAKEKGFDINCDKYTIDKKIVGAGNQNKNLINAPTQSLLQKFIREKRGVHIEIHKNASGYYWSMCKVDGGTDLGWSKYSGQNMGGTWNSFEDSLENALQVQLSYDLPRNTKIIKHWGNYVEVALKIKENYKKYEE